MKSKNYARSSLAHLLSGEPAPILATDGFLYLSLHSGDPGSADDQTYLEVEGTQRAAISRTKTAWNSEVETFTNANLISMKPTSESEKQRTATHWALGTAFSGKGSMKISGKLNKAQKIVDNLIVEFPAGAIKIDEF